MIILRKKVLILIIAHALWLFKHDYHLNDVTIDAIKIL